MKHRLMLPILGAAALLLAACDASTVVTETDPTKITYSRDTRTKLCFATAGRGAPFLAISADSFSMTGVPCTPEVLALVPARQRG